MSRLFERASREAVRFMHTTGLITVEDLWNLPLSSLNAIAQKVSKAIKDSGEENFISDTPTVNPTYTLMLDIIKYIIGVRKEEKRLVLNAKADKQHNSKIDELIEAKKDAKMADMSIEELEKLKRT